MNINSYNSAYIEATHTLWIRREKRLGRNRSDEWVYAPLHEPALFVEFANLFGDGPVFLDAAPPVVLDWVGRHGVLGVYEGYPTRNGGAVWGRHDDRESVVGFVRRPVEANRCWRLLAAAKGPDGPNVEKLRELGARGDTPSQLAKWAEKTVDETVDMYLESETCMRRYRRRDGSTFRGPGFHSLLGAMYLQMSNFREAPQESIIFCRWCGDVVAFEEGESPPIDAPNGTRGKHKTHRNRRFCKEKYGIKNYCKNKFNYEWRKKAAKEL